MTHTKFHFKQGKTNKHKVTPSPSPFSGSVLLESEADDRSAVCAEVVLCPNRRSCFRFFSWKEKKIMSFNGLKRMLTLNTANAIAYLTSPNSDRRIGFRVYNDMLEEKFRYRRPEFLQLNEESEQASADHEIRPILIPHRELPLDAGYAE